MSEQAGSADPILIIVTAALPAAVGLWMAAFTPADISMVGVMLTGLVTALSMGAAAIIAARSAAKKAATDIAAEIKKGMEAQAKQITDVSTKADVIGVKVDGTAARQEERIKLLQQELDIIKKYVARDDSTARLLAQEKAQATTSGPATLAAAAAPRVELTDAEPISVVVVGTTEPVPVEVVVKETEAKKPAK